MKKEIFPLLFALMGTSGLQAQSLQGHVLDEQKKPIAFARIELHELGKQELLTGSISDTKGGYELQLKQPAKLRLVVSFVGYKTYVDTLQINGDLTLEVRLKPELTTLKGVEVQAKRSKRTGATTLYLNEEARKISVSAHALLTHTPDLKYNALQGVLTTAEGEKLHILINGIRASEAQLRTIPPNKVKRLIYYDLPSARYQGIGKVLDVIVADLDDGGTASLYMLQAPTIKLGDYGLNGSYHRG